MSGIFLGNRTKIFYNPDAGNTTVNSVGYVEIDLLASFPQVTISSDNTSIETYQDEYTQIISGSLNINTVSIVVHYVPDNLSHQYLLDRFSDGEKFQIKISLYESDESLDQHYIILGGYCTAYSDSSDQNAVFDRTYTFTAEDVVSRGTAQDQPNLSWGDFGIGADGLTVPHYESSTPSGNSLIKVPALQEQNPLGVDMYGTAWVDGTDTLKLAGNAQGTPHLYVQNSDTDWTKIPEQSEINATFTPMTRKVNGYDLSTDIVLSKSDVGLSTVTDDPQLKIASNLSDLDSVSTARANLNVYSKTETDNSYVTKTLTINGHDLNTDIVLSKSDVGLSTVTDDAQLKIASNLSDLNDTATARTNLDVYSKEETDSTYVAIANNLSDIDATEARTNLEVLSSTESDAKYAQLGINSDITDLTALSGSLELGADAQSDYDAVTLRQLQSAISAGGSGGPSLNGVMNNQIGAVSWFVGTRATMWSGCLPADGQLLNRADYPDVWSAISNGLLSSTTDATWTGSATERAKYSTGDGSTTFRMPDLNGAYSGSYVAPVLRGDGSGTYTVGQMQQNAAPNITGVIRQVAEDAGLYEQNGQTGAFYPDTTRAQYWNLFSLTKSGTGGAFPSRIGIDASRSSAVYGRDNTTEIRMNAAIGIWVIRVKGSFSAVGTNFNVINADTTAPSTGTVVYGGDLISKYQVGGADYSAVKIRAKTTIDGDIVPELVVIDSRGTSTTQTSSEIPLLNKANVWTTSNQFNQSLEIGIASQVYTPYIDFHSSGNGYDYDCRIISSGGSSSASGKGTLQIYGGTIQTNTGSILTITGDGSTTAPTGAGDSARMIYAGADSASFTSTCNINLASWYGIGFLSSYTSPSNGVVAGQCAAFINTRLGNFYARNAVYANTTALTSDRNAKENIVEIDDALSLLSQLKTYTFNYKNSGAASAGLIAQEVQEVFPDFVTKLDDIEYLSLDYNAILGYVYRGVVQLNDERLAMKAKLDAIESFLESKFPGEYPTEQ
ncbi:tail fiber domain-containing protein [Mangrovibacter plantisponsor]|uniref:Endosialidase-like protein n=1 Tax=Mangrovibacter plantisponsor TaxID=451513 RepID=A0A317PUK5_9ENTR|nr:tail fiber domain-containing protein [Mangrovibacter plantisponsor]PWW04980.1 endosialidase-like protein [Mangrovibacter plantisponsor]